MRPAFGVRPAACGARIAAFGFRLWAFGLVAVLGLAACTPNARPPADRAATRARNLLLVTIDTMRADHVGAYGYAAAQTPVMDRLAREGARFDRAFATAPITLTSHASLLTGLYPPGHGARHNGVAMRGDVPTLAASLQRTGVRDGRVRRGVPARPPLRPRARLRRLRRPHAAGRQRPARQRAARGQRR